MTLSKPDPARAASPRYGASGLPLASSVDLSANLPPIGNQGSQNSCVGWSVGYYAKTWFEKAEHPSWNLSQQSNQMSPQFVWSGINGGRDVGTSIDAALEYMGSSGCTDWEEFPYSGDAGALPGAQAVEAAKQYKIPADWGYFFCEGSWTIPPRGDVINSLKVWLNSGKPLVLGIPVYDDFPDYSGNPHTGYYLHSASSEFMGGHAVCIAGYNDNANPSGGSANTRGGFLMINSWGPSWNGNGKVYLSYDFIQRYVPEAWYFNDADSSPTMSSISPAGAGAGQIVTISGNNLGARRRSAHVAFQGSSVAQYVAWSNSEIKVKVPSNAHTGYLYVYDWESEKTGGKVFSMGKASYAGSNWLLAEGSTWPGYDEWVLLQNPDSQGSNVNVAFLTPSGPVKGPDVTVPAMSRTSIHVNDYLPNSDVSTAITVKSGANVCAERAMYFSSPDGKWGSHDSIAAPGVSNIWYLAEGATWPGYDEWILVMNPFDNRVMAGITFQTPQGDIAGPTLDMAPNSRQSVHVNQYVPGNDVSATVRCMTDGCGIVAERSMYFKTPDGKIDCHNSMGAVQTSSVWGMAEGATWPGYEEWVLVQNPTTKDANV
ncbi:MAG TPA: C1 family peptidase, partial [Candidatus Anoxymicrobiaceae bacterium]